MKLLSLRDRRARRTRRDRNTRRFREIVGVAVRYGLADRLQKVPSKRIQQWLRGSTGQSIVDLPTPVRLRLALSDLGTTFIKFGQMLSTRADLVGHEVAQELSQLQSGTPPDPPGRAEATVMKELGKAPGELFAEFDPQPFASASIAQVHRAQLHTGESVVLKVQKDGVEARVETDLSILSDLADLAERYIDELKPYHPIAVVHEFSRMIRGELDFQRELTNIRQFRENFADDHTVHFPVPYPGFSSRRVLTMERLEGALVSHLSVAEQPEGDMQEFARRGAHMYLEMIFRDAFYHADPHPGNLMLLPNGVVGVLDCGMVQRLDDHLREQIEDLLLAAVQGDPTSVVDAVCDLSTSPPPGGRRKLQTDIRELVEDFSGQTIAGLDVGGLLNSLTEVIHRNQLFLPPGASLLIRMLAELEGTAKQLNPSFHLMELLEPYAEKSAKRRFAPARVWREVQRNICEWERLVHALPNDLNNMLDRIRAGTFSVHLEHRRLDPVVNRLVLGILASSLYLGSSLLWAAHAQPLVGGVSLFGAIGYAIAVMMTVRLLRQIKGSEQAPEERR
jgi:ubiquinone biosynthesis protein